jgi:hypothetical protein
MLPLPNYDKSHLYLAPAVVLLCIGLWLARAHDVEWTIALNGFSPIDWVAHLVSPQNFVKDFANGMAIYGKSSFMWIYPAASSAFGIPPEALIKAVIFFEIVFLVFSSVIFCRALFPAAPPYAAYIFALLLVSGTTNMDLANFGRPTFWGLYYNFADGMRLLGVALYLKRRLFLSAVFLAISFTTHPIMALAACVFIAGTFLVERDIGRPSQIVTAVLVFLVLVAAWWLPHMASTNLTSGRVDPQTWVAIARAFNYHLFPYDYGLLTIYHDYRLLPLLCLIALAVGYLPLIESNPRRRMALLAGLAALGAMTLAGLWISVDASNPALLKLALHRASDMLLVVALAMGVSGAVAVIASGNKLTERGLALATLMSPFLMKPGFPVLGVLALLGYRAWDAAKTMSAAWQRNVLLLFGGVVLVLASGYALNGVLPVSKWPTYLGSIRFWQTALVAGVTFWLIRRYASENQVRLSLGVVAVVFVPLFVFAQWKAIPDDRERLLGKDYLEVQRWAKSNTEPTALFMVDPTIYYGWRDFSARSSFGNIREWLHTSWLYDSREASYREGMRRFNEFGLDLTHYLYGKQESSIDWFNTLDRDFRKRFYGLPSRRLAEIGATYDVDYFVLKRTEVGQCYDFPVAFENRSFVVFRRL